MSNENCRRVTGRISASILMTVSYLLSMTPGGLAAQATAPPASSQTKLPTKEFAVSVPLDRDEDFNSLGLGGQRLLSLPPALVEKTDVPANSFVREQIHLKWRMIDSLELYVAIPKGVKKPPVVLYLYSYPESANRFKIDSWTASTTNAGMASVGFVSFLTADRIPDGRPEKEWFVSELRESLVTSVHDVQMILNYLASRGDLDMDHVGMFGVGSGGTIAILASAVDPRIKAIDVFDPWGDWPDWLAKSLTVPEEQRAQLLSEEFLKAAAPFDPLQWFPQVKAQRVRIQSIRSEATVPEAAQKKMEAVAPDTAEINQFGDYAAFSAVEPATSVFGWLPLVLQPDSKYKADPDKAKRVHFYPGKATRFDPGAPHP